MLVIRLQRTGRENLPTYRVVVAEKSQPVKGGFLENLGHYLPAIEPAVIEVNSERIAYWVSKGACPSDTVARLLKRKGLKGMDSFIKRYAKRKSKSEQSAEAASAAPAATAPAPAVQEATA